MWGIPHHAEMYTLSIHLYIIRNICKIITFIIIHMQKFIFCFHSFFRLFFRFMAINHFYSLPCNRRIENVFSELICNRNTYENDLLHLTWLGNHLETRIRHLVCEKLSLVSCSRGWFATRSGHDVALRPQYVRDHLKKKQWVKFCYV